MNLISIACLPGSKSADQWKGAGLRLRGATVAVAENSWDSLAPFDDGCAICAIELTAANIPPLIDRLKRGCPVLVGGSSDLTDAVLQELERASATGAGRLAVVNPDRHLPSRRLMREQLAAGKLGAPGLVRAHRWECATNRGNLADAPQLPTPVLRDLDSVLWLCGASPNVVYASQLAASDDPASQFQYVQIHLGFPGGGMALLDYTNSLPEGAGYAALSVIGACGAAYADDHQNMQLVFQGGLPRAALVDEEVQQLASLLQDFSDGLGDGRDFADGAAAWRRVLVLQDAALRSLAQRQAILLESP